MTGPERCAAVQLGRLCRCTGCTLCTESGEAVARYRTTIRSHRRAEETFEYLSNFATTSEWDPGVVEAERLSNGPVELGSTFRVVASFLGRRVSLLYRIVEFEPGRRVVLRADAPMVRSVDEI